MPTLAEHNGRLRKAGLPTVETLTRRILAVWGRASKSNVESGAIWYEDAKAFARTWAFETDHTLEQSAAVLSHLSPRTTWTRNVMGAGDLLRYGRKGSGIIDANYQRAVIASKSDDPESTFGGPKTLRFYRNILGDTDAVTVDVWAARVAGVDDALLSRKGIYDAVEAAFQRAAYRVGVEPTTMQATTWIVARNGRAA